MSHPARVPSSSLAPRAPAWQLVATALVLGVLCVGAAHAATAGASSGGGLPWEAPLKKLQESISGPVAFVIALLGIIACGATLIWGGEISEFTKRIIYVVLVICLLVFSNSILSSLFGAVVPAGVHVAAADLVAYAHVAAPTAAR